jgi:MarR family 2-MHQ and catechol resistance regulon transcriptional repressor
MLLSEVGRRLLLTSGSVTYAMDKLEKLGLVQRVACPQDRRKIYAHLTDAGKEKIESVFPPHAEAITEAVSGLSSDEQDAAVELLKKMGLFAAKF